MPPVFPDVFFLFFLFQSECFFFKKEHVFGLFLAAAQLFPCLHWSKGDLVAQLSAVALKLKVLAGC